VGGVLFEISRLRAKIEEWILAQPEFPSRKRVRERFPDVDVKHIRAALQACEDRVRGR
jgi:hypothetical protein